MKILRMTQGLYDVSYVVQGGKFGIEWMDDMEVIHMLATQGTKAEVKKIDKDNLYGALLTYFDDIWNDKNGVDLDDEFNKLFEAAEDFL